MRNFAQRGRNNNLLKYSFKCYLKHRAQIKLPSNYANHSASLTQFKCVFSRYKNWRIMEINKKQNISNNGVPLENKFTFIYLLFLYFFFFLSLLPPNSFPRLHLICISHWIFILGNDGGKNLKKKKITDYEAKKRTRRK